MKHMALQATLLAAIAGGSAGAADYRQNPFTEGQGTLQDRERHAH